MAARYGFIHALYQEVMYDRVPAGQRVRWHRRIGARMEAGYGEQAREIAAELAEHFVRGRDAARAVQYLRYAGENAWQRSAPQEAITHLTKGLEVLTTLPVNPAHIQQELMLLTALGPAFVHIKGPGAPEVEHTYVRARDLCQQLGDPPQLFFVLEKLQRIHDARGELQTTRELGEQLLSLAHHQRDAARLLIANYRQGQTLFYLGELTRARKHFEQGIALRNPHQHHVYGLVALKRGNTDWGILCLPYVSWILWLLGYPDQALQRIHEASTLAREVSHSFSLMIVMFFATRLHQFRREWQAARQQAETQVKLTREKGYTGWLVEGAMQRGAVLAEQGQGETGIAQIRQGLAALHTTGDEVGRPWYLARLAEAYGNVGQVDEGLRALSEALAFRDKTGERWWEAELYRLKGELLLKQTVPNEHQAKTCFHQSLDIARGQQAKSLELRAAMSLSRLWQRQGKRTEARQLLVEVYGWFTEGFDTADLKDAKGLLDELAEGSAMTGLP